MRRLITDFDGPIIDVSEHYRVYKFNLDSTRRPDQQVQLDKSAFWQLKRSRVPEKQMALFPALTVQAQDFAQLRWQTMHTQSEYDCLAPERSTLEKVQQAGVDLAVMTMRRVQS